MNLQRLLPARVLKTGKYQIDGELGCVIWTGAATGRGYGVINILGKTTQLHSFVFFHYYNFYPEVVAHTCDTPLCINPLHLFASTQIGNQKDKLLKGRQAKGEHHGKAKLSAEQALEAIELRKTGMLYREIAARYNVHKDTIRSLCSGKNWKHLKDDTND